MNLAKSQDTKSIYRNHLHFYILTMKYQKEKLRNHSHSPLQNNSSSSSNNNNNNNNNNRKKKKIYTNKVT